MHITETVSGKENADKRNRILNKTDEFRKHNPPVGASLNIASERHGGSVVVGKKIWSWIFDTLKFCTVFFAGH